MILVTGGAGFIGSNFVRYLLENTNESVIVLDSLTYAGNLRNLQYLPENYPERFALIIGDINHSNLDMMLGGYPIKAIVNFAAESHVDRSILDSSIFIKTNIGGTQNLLEFARKNKVSRFLQISTDEVYGSLEPNQAPSVESDDLKPNSPYAASKASADLLCRAAYKTYNQDVIVTRASNNYGPYQFPEKLIPLMLINALNDKELPVYGDGQQIRDWIHVNDHCTGIYTALIKGKAGEVYNIGSNNPWPNIDIVNLILEKTAKPVNLIKYVNDRLGHDVRYHLNADKLKNLGWDPKVSFSQGLVSTINWYIENKFWWSEILNEKY